MTDPTITAFSSEILDARRAISAALAIGLTGREAIGVGQEALFKIRSGIDRNSAIHSTLKRITQERSRMFDPDSLDVDPPQPARWRADEFLAIAVIVIFPLLLVGLGYWMGAS